MSFFYLRKGFFHTFLFYTLISCFLPSSFLCLSQ